MRYIYRDLELDADAYAIFRHGRLVEVQPLVFDLIIYLIHNRQRAVTKIELLQQVWRGCNVENSAIARCVCVARRILQDPAAIRTVRGRGYQWFAPVALSSDKQRSAE